MEKQRSLLSYQADQRWIAAQLRYVDDGDPDESSEMRMVRRDDAAREMFRIEQEWNGAT